MSESEFKLLNPPIVEAVLDIECDLPSGQQLATLEVPARECFRDRYPKFRPQFVQEHQIEFKQDEPPKLAVRHGMQALQFLQEDEKQLVQVRLQGFSFNRLSPYTSLDDYLPEIERTWRLYAGLASPIQVRLIRLRYINRILLPMKAGGVQLEDYFKVGPRLPDEDKFRFAGFLNQYAAVEVETGNQVNIVLTAQAPEGQKLPIIFDNAVAAVESGEPENWPWILLKIEGLRALKNHIFRRTLSNTCLNLFQQP
ncbi:MAG: TIGR04255 family protein [Gammaproteobacteria bacterium]